MSDIQSVGQGHDDVHDDQLHPGARGLQHFHRLFPGFGFEDAKPPFAEQPVRHASDGGLIIDDQDTGRTPNIQ